MALDKLTLLDETVVNNTATSLIQSTATSTSNTIFTDRFITYKNKIINGNFDFWQRGTSLGSASGGRFLADRWLNNSVGTTYTTSQQSFTLGQANVPNEPSFFHRTVATSVVGSNNFNILAQTIESVRTLAGKTATLSFWAKADSSKNIAIEFAQSFGTGGSPSSGILEIGVTTCNLTTSWQKFTITTSIPSISGKTLGTNGNDYLAINFWFDAGSSFNSRTNSLGQQSGTFDIAQVQLEEGSVATPFEERPRGLELSLCQRYYVSYVIPQDYSDGYNNAILYRNYFLPVEMRVQPSSFTILTQFQYYSGGTAANVTPTFSGVSGSRQSFIIFTSGLTSGRGLLAGRVGINVEI